MAAMTHDGQIREALIVLVPIPMMNVKPTVKAVRPALLAMAECFT